MTASQKVHLRRCASSFVVAAYFYVRFIPQDSRALHLELFTVPSTFTTFTKSSILERKKRLRHRVGEQRQFAGLSMGPAFCFASELEF
jgi:hypothetical protein